MAQIIKHMIIHRKYPDNKWEFRAVSVRIRDDDGKLKDIVFGKGIDKGKRFVGVEIYVGSNYIVGSSDRSYSRRYSLKNVPKKYRYFVDYAKRIHNNTKWSNQNRIDMN